jgi:hypothetical protein
VTYDEWLSLTEDERERKLSGWNPHEGEGEDIVIEAGRRLMLTNPAIVETCPGVWHGGEWIIQAYVSQPDWERLPRFPFHAQVFDGLRVYYTYGTPPSQRLV